MAPRMHQIVPEITLASAPKEWSAVELAPFSAVLNVAGESASADRSRLAPGCEMILAPFEDNCPAPYPFLALACLELRRSIREGKHVLVHCQAGQSRSPTVVALYLMARDRLTWEEAVLLLRERRRMVDPHPLLTNPHLRDRIVSVIQRYLDGEVPVRNSIMREREELLLADSRRTPEIVPKRGDWNLISEGLAIGSSPTNATNLQESGYCRTLCFNCSEPCATSEVTSFRGSEDSFDFSEPVELVLCSWASGETCYLRCSEGRHLSAAVGCLALMSVHGWDYGSAFWFVKRRRPNIVVSTRSRMAVL